MNNSLIIIISLLINIFVFAYRVLPAFCDDLLNSSYEDTSRVISWHGDKSFYKSILSGKQNMIEEGFYDVPHKPNKFDYLKEEMEHIRTYSRPDDEFAILNLQWKNGNIFVNDFKTISGKIKKTRGLLPEAGSKFFYRLFSDKAGTVRKQYFNIPANLNFDFFDEKTGVITGGAFIRDEADFVIKIPLSDKSAWGIQFLKENLKPEKLSRTERKKGFSAKSSDLEETETILGETLF